MKKTILLSLTLIIALWMMVGLMVSGPSFAQGDDNPTQVPSETPTDAPTDDPEETATAAPTDVPTDAPEETATEAPADVTEVMTEVATETPADRAATTAENKERSDDTDFTIGFIITMLAVVVVAGGVFVGLNRMVGNGKKGDGA